MAGGLSGLGGGIGNAIGQATSGKGGKNNYRAALEALQGVDLSSFDLRSLPAPVLQVLASQQAQTYDPTAPEEFTGVDDSAQGRDAQVDALSQMQQYEQGNPLLDRLNQQENARSVQDASAGAQDAALRGLRARGNLGGGDEIQARLAGNQTSANLGRDLASRSAEDAALRRMQAVGQVGSMGSRLRGQDVDVSQANADIDNRYKSIFASVMNQGAKDNAAAAERSQEYNVGTKQRTGEANEVGQYATAKANLDRQNALKGKTFDQEMQKAQGVADAYGNLGAWDDAQRAARIGAATGLGAGIGGIADDVVDAYTGGGV